MFGTGAQERKSLQQRQVVKYRQPGNSTLKIPVVSFGAGPVSGLMVGDDQALQLQTISRAFELGIDYFDTAATYGDGRSEMNLGVALRTLGITEKVQIATKVRLMPNQLDNIGSAIRESFEASCRRLGVERIALLQLHNSITIRRDDLPTSLSVRDVLGAAGVVDELEKLRKEGRVAHFGFTGLGDTVSLSTVVRDGPFVAAQIPLNLLLPISGADASAGSVDVDYLELAEMCHENNVGVIGIRVFAGGALAGQEPSPHTYRTKFFTLDVFERDRRRAEQISSALPREMSLGSASIRYVTGTLNATTALIGFANPQQVEAAVASSEEGQLGASLVKQIGSLVTR